MHPTFRLPIRSVPCWSFSFGVMLGLAAVLLPAASARAFVGTPNQSCAEGEYQRWYAGPTTWYMNENGYSQIDFDTLLSVVQRGLDVWSEPCCSSFQSKYLGTTSQGVGFPPEKNVLFFAEDEASWPRELGTRGAVIATTMRQGTPACSIVSAFMIFNGIDRQFVATEEVGKQEIELLSIVVHEFGHWLGLGHTDVASAVMRPTYNPGTKYTGLHEDDIEGVCTIYPGSCETCFDDDDCPGESFCSDGACTLLECYSTYHCPMGSVCVDSSCVPGCRSHQECGAEEGCLDGSCVPNGASCEKHVDCAAGESCVNRRCGVQPSSCTICEVCSFDSDCGPEAMCLSTDAGGRCIKPCEVDRDCPGDSVCRQAAGAMTSLCLNPSDSPLNNCPATYSCEVAEPGPELGCAMLGEPCTGGSLGCGGRSDTCYDAADGPACSCTCRSDDECGPAARCLVDPSNDLPTCYPEAMVTACGETFCLPEQRCTEEGCAPDPCYGVSCGEGEVCTEGHCELPKDSTPKPKAGSKGSKGGCSAGGGAGGLPLVALFAGLTAFRPLKKRNKRLCDNARFNIP